MKTAFAAAAGLVLLAGAAEAACDTHIVGGTWLAILDLDTTCVMEVSTAGNIARGRCYNFEAGGFVGTLAGTFTVGRPEEKVCRLRADFTRISGKKRVAGKVIGVIDPMGEGFSAELKSDGKKLMLVGLKQW